MDFHKLIYVIKLVMLIMLVNLHKLFFNNHHINVDYHCHIIGEVATFSEVQHF